MDPLAAMPPAAPFKLRLPAPRVASGDAAGGLVAFCPFCEGLHHHGGERGGRARHCAPDTGMPFSSYELTDGGKVEQPGNALPAGIYVGTGRTLRAACEERGAELRRTLALILLDMTGPWGRVLRQRTPRGAVAVTVADRTGIGSAAKALPCDDWTVATPDGRETTGRGLIDLAGTLFGVSAAVVALRTLEAVLGARLDAEAAAAVCGAVARWDARGRPGPQDGPHPHRA